MPRLSQPDRELFLNLARREIRGRYKGSWLGLAWTLIIPLVMMATYTVVFSVLWDVADIPHYWLYLLVGIGFWAFFGGGIIAAAGSLIQNKNLVTKVAFPRALVPISSLTSHAVTMLVMLALMVPFSIALAPNHGLALLWLPPLLVGLAVLVTGIALAVSVLNVYFRDLEHIIAALLIPWFFITPIIYRLDAMPQLQDHAWAEALMTYANIATPYVMAFQDVIYYGRTPGLELWLYIFGVGAAVLVGGAMVFNRLQRDLAVEL